MALGGEDVKDVVPKSKNKHDRIPRLRGWRRKNFVNNRQRTTRYLASLIKADAY